MSGEKPEGAIAIHVERRDAVWYGIKLGFGIAFGAMFCLSLLWQATKLLVWLGL